MSRFHIVRPFHVPCALVFSGLALLGGCADPVTKPPDGFELATGFEERRKQIAADPIAFLEKSMAKARKVKAFTTTFERQERLGLIRRLKPIERIYTEYRDKPFSVRFTWLDENSDYQQCVFVENENDGKVLLLPRKGLFGLPPKVGRYDKRLAVLLGKARNPITDFGPRRMIERTLDRIAKARPHGKVTIQVSKSINFNGNGKSKEPCFHLVIRYPEDDQYACKLHDLYISTRTLLPVASWLWLPGEQERTDETLDAMYIYNNLDSDIELPPDTFAIDPDMKLPGDPSRHAGGPHPTPDGTRVTATSSGDGSDQ